MAARTAPTPPTTTPCCATVGSTDFDVADATELAKGFAALADPVRLHLLSMITTAGPGGACVCDLIEPSGRSQPTVSHHLKVLREAQCRLDRGAVEAAVARFRAAGGGAEPGSALQELGISITVSSCLRRAQTQARTCSCGTLAHLLHARCFDGHLFEGSYVICNDTQTLRRPRTYPLLQK